MNHVLKYLGAGTDFNCLILLNSSTFKAFYLIRSYKHEINWLIFGLPIHIYCIPIDMFHRLKRYGVTKRKQDSKYEK